MAVRKLKLTDGQSVDNFVGVGLQKVKKILKKKVGEVTSHEIQQLADSWEVIDKQAKELTSIAKKIKSLLLDIARKNGCTILSGSRYEAEVGDTVKTIVIGTPTDLARLLKKEKRMELFNTIVSIKVGDAKKLLGTDLLEKSGIIKFEKKKMDRINIRPIKR